MDQQILVIYYICFLDRLYADRMQLCSGWNLAAMSYISLSLNTGLQQQPYFLVDGISLWPMRARKLMPPFTTIRLCFFSSDWTAHEALGQTSVQLWWHVREITSSKLMGIIPARFTCTSLYIYTTGTVSLYIYIYLQHLVVWQTQLDICQTNQCWHTHTHTTVYNCQRSISVEPGMLGLAVSVTCSLPWDLFYSYVMSHGHLLT